MKYLDIITAVLLIIGGINWGLIGFFRFDLVAAIGGTMSVFTRLIYSLVGISAVYQVLTQASLRKRRGLTATHP